MTDAEYEKREKQQFGEYFTNNSLCRYCKERRGLHYGFECPEVISNNIKG